MSNRHEDPDAGEAGQDARWLTGLLDTEAGRYSPDGRRIRAVMHQRMRGGRRREFPRIRMSPIPAGIVTATLVAAAAVAVIVTVGSRQPPAVSSPAAVSRKLPPASRNPVTGSSAGTDGRATQSAVGGNPGPASAAPAPSSSPAPSASADSAPSASADSSPSASADSSPSASADSSPSDGTGAELVSATGSSDLGAFPYWIQEEVTVSLGKPVTSFKLTVTVARSAGVASTGHWTTYDPAIFDVTVAARASAVIYTFTLRPGHTLPAGSATFAVQFDHWTAHNPADDFYALTAASDEQHPGVQGTALGSL